MISYNAKDVRAMNKCVLHTKGSFESVLRHKKLNEHSFRLVAISDASIGNNQVLSSNLKHNTSEKGESDFCKVHLK